MTDFVTGLTGEQVQERMRAGHVNTPPRRTSRGVPRIIFENIFTFFNLINAILGVLVIWVGSYKNALFLMVVVINTAIGIVQELRAKRTLDRLTLLAAAKVTTIRDGQQTSIDFTRLVMDDIMLLNTGNQVCADAVLVDGTIEVNESLLTGEADAILKQPGDELLSGSYVVSGQARAQVTRVGADNYANRITAQARMYKRHASQLRRAMNSVLGVVSVIIVPLGVGFFMQQLSLNRAFDDTIVRTVAAVLGMIPEGLVLLTTIALAVGVVNLGRKSTLVRELFAIEMLARVDVVCLDKTGTLTEGRMQVQRVEPLCDAPVDDIMGNLMRVSTDDNETARALKRHFAPLEGMAATDVVTFSSDRKYSGATLEGQGLCLVGAYESLFPPERRDADTAARATHHAEQGIRVLTLARGADDKHLQPVAFILLSDTVRPEAKRTLDYFDEQGVRLMILSGDHPRAVAHIATEAGLTGGKQPVDAGDLGTQEDIAAAIGHSDVFGRVTPDQKKRIVEALQAEGHTVAMVGDGVNDVPALKAADCSVAMAAGSDAAKQCAGLVLLDSNFDALPFAVHEGRRVINNIQSAASLFLVKTFYSAILTFIMLCFSAPYPFMPIHLTLISSCAVGIPTFIFALQPNGKRVESGFFTPVLRHALTGALTVVLWVCVSLGFARTGIALETLSTMCLITTGITCLYLIPRVYPLNNWLRKAVYGAMLTVFLIALTLKDFLSLNSLDYYPAILTVIMVVLTPMALDGMSVLVERGLSFYSKLKSLKKQ